MKKELLFASFGLYPEQMTLEAVADLKKCEKVYFTSLSRENSRLMLSLFPGAELLNDVPFEGLILTVMGAFASCGRVGVVDHGDPAFLCEFSKRLRAAAGRRGVAFKELRAISSLNAILAEFDLGGLGPLGLCLTNAHSWPEAGKYASNRIPLLVFSPDRARLNGDKEGCLAGLAAYVKKNYPPGHAIYFIKCADAASRPALKRRVRVASFGRALTAVEFDTSLYIPPVTGW